MIDYDEIDREIIKFVQGNMPLSSRPYQTLAHRLGISEEDIIGRVKAMVDRGLIRRMGAVLRHQQAGFTTNAMVVWKTDGIDADHAGRVMSRYDQVSHCYLRQVPDEFGYSLFAMIHARSRDELSRTVTEIAAETGLKEYKIIRSLKEFKKASMQYL